MSDDSLWGSRRGSGNRGWVATTAHAPLRTRTILHSGGNLNGVHRVPRADREVVLVLAGTNLVALDFDGSILWSRGDLGVTRVVEVMPAIDAALVVGGRDRVLLVDILSGGVRWSWRHTDGFEIAGPGSLRIFPHQETVLLFIAPGYSTIIHCIELTRTPRQRWEHDFAGTIDAGFGPVLVVADVLGHGAPQLILSSRTGSGYGTNDVASERLVLGREDGQVYQAALDLQDGALLAETQYRPDSSDYPAARPYGLLQAGPSVAGDVVLVSCQVEEYVAVTAANGPLRRRWGWFVEKDWPRDLQELRPQTTSVADVLGDGRPRLVLGHWDGATWATLILDVLGSSSDGSCVRLDGRYFWGTADIDGDGVPELITSTERTRRPHSRTRLEIVDARTEQTIAALGDVELLTVDDEPLPADRIFHADHRGAATISDDQGRVGLVIVDAAGYTDWWHLGRDRSGAPRRLLGRAAVRVDARPGGVALSDERGTIALLDAKLRVTRMLSVEGRNSRLLLRMRAASVEVIADRSDGRLVGVIDGEAAWTVAGTAAAIHRDRDGSDTIVTLSRGPDDSLVTVYDLDDKGPRQRSAWLVNGDVDGILLFGETLSVAATRRTGPHGSNLIAFDREGEELWRDDTQGVHASDPLAYFDDGWRVATDDHGILTIRVARTGTILTQTDWTAAYTTPISVQLDGRRLLVRGDGTHGLELCTPTGSTLWRRPYDVFSIHPGVSVVNQDAAEPYIAVPRKGGHVDILRLRDGDLIRSLLVGAQSQRRPLVGVGKNLLVGTLVGDVIAIDPATGTESWRAGFPAAVVELAAVADAGRAFIAVSTADGAVSQIDLGEA